MNYLDIGIIVVALLFFAFGLWKGFLKPCITLAGLAGAIVLIYFFAGKFGEVLTNSFVGGWVRPIFDGLVGKLGDSAALEVVEGEGGLVLAGTGTLITGILSSTFFLPGFIADGLVGSMTVGVTLGENLSYACSIYLCTVIAALIIFIAMMIVTNVVKIFVRNVAHFAPVKWLDRIIGGVLYLAIGVLVIYIILTVLSMLASVMDNSFATTIKDMMNAENSLTKLMMQYNPINMLIQAITGK